MESMNEMRIVLLTMSMLVGNIVSVFPALYGSRFEDATRSSESFRNNTDKVMQVAGERGIAAYLLLSGFLYLASAVILLAVSAITAHEPGWEWAAMLTNMCLVFVGIATVVLAAVSGTLFGEHLINEYR